MTIRRAFALALIAALAACSQGAGTPSLPSAFAPAAGAHHKLKTKLVIKVPRRKKRHGDRGRHSHYVSPATASLAYAIDGGSSTIVNLSPSNPNCSVVGPISYLQCSIEMALAPGNHTFSFTTYDGPNGSGNVLSANTSVAYDVKAGAANEIPAILGGVATALSVMPLNASLQGSASGGYDIYGPAPQKFGIVPVDADDNYIIGPGAPQPAVQATPANVTMSTPSPASPNVWTFASTYAASDPTVPSATSLSVSATPVPNSGGNTVSATVALNLYQPWVYVPSCNFISACTMTEYDEQGNQQGSFTAAFGSFGGATYDPENKTIYMTSPNGNAVYAYSPTGVQQTLTGNGGSPFPGLDHPWGIVYDPHNHLIYVACNDISFGTNSITVYDEQGNQQTVSGTFPNLNGVRQITFDPNTDTIYAAQSAGNTVTAYDEQGNQVTLSGNFAGLNFPVGITFDSDNGFLYVGSNSSNTLTAYDEQGNQQTLTGSFPNATGPLGVLFDPFDRFLYVASTIASSVTVYNEQGQQQTLGGSWPGVSSPSYLALVP